jgi:hypothetical protein
VDVSVAQRREQAADPGHVEGHGDNSTSQSIGFVPTPRDAADRSGQGQWGKMGG